VSTAYVNYSQLEVGLSVLLWWRWRYTEKRW